MLSGKRPYWKIAMLLSSSLIFLLSACGDLVTEEEITGEEGKGDTQTGILSKSYSSLDPQYALVSNPKIISVPERGQATAINVSANLSFIFNGVDTRPIHLNANMGIPFTSKVFRNGKELGVAEGSIGANCPLKGKFESTDTCEHNGSLSLIINGEGQLINGEWELGEIELVDNNYCTVWSGYGGGCYKAEYLSDYVKNIKFNDWSLTIDYIPTLTSHHKNTSKKHLPDADKRYDVYSSIIIPQIYSGPLSGGLSGLLINVDIAHKDPKDLVIKLEHNEKAVTLLELAKATQVQNGLQRRFSLSDVPELSTFVGGDIAGEWRLWLVDETRGYEGDLNWWSLELTPTASN